MLLMYDQLHRYAVHERRIGAKPRFNSYINAISRREPVIFLQTCMKSRLVHDLFELGRKYGME